MNERNNQDQLGLYVQDQIKFGPLTLVLSGRLDEVWTKTDNYKTPGFSYSDQDSAFSGRAGLVYNVGFGLAPYISYSNSFEPLMGVTTSGRPLKPELGEQYEVGVKFQPENSHSFITIAAFDLTRQNFLVADPANFFNEKQSGEARSRGIEIEAVANLFGGLNLIASYTKFDIKNTENIDTALIGLAPGNTVDNYASTFLDYTIPDGAMKGFGGGFGVRYTGSAYVDELNKKSVPSYTLGDAVIHYEKDGWRGAVNVSNIFDKTYVAQCSSDIQCFYGERRKFTASLTYRW
jgi:iron complex outermembrane receptor protein